MQKSLLEKLSELRAASCQELPTPELAVLARAVAKLRRDGVVHRCLQVGETVPDFPFIGVNNEPGSLYQQLDRGPVVLNFFRGFWCTYCRSELEAYQQVQDRFAEVNCSYIAISPQQPPADGPFPYTVIFDRANQLARQFGIVYELTSDEVALFTGWGLRLDEMNETGRWELPLPATYIVNQNHTVGYQFTDPDFRTRCCPVELLRELDYLLTSR